MEAFMNYKSLSKDKLLKLIHELEVLNKELLFERAQEDHLEFSWSGNLGHWYLNFTTNHVVFNPLKVESLGYSMDELPEQVHYNFFTSKLHPDDYEHTMNQMRLNMQGQIPIYECEYRILTKTEGYKWFYDRGKVTQRDSSGNPILAAGIVFDITEKKLSEQKLLEEKNYLEEQSKTDSLTSLHNRRSIMDALVAAQITYERFGTGFSIAIFDIDLFKEVNDKKGHVAGDQVIKEVASIILQNIRTLDLAGRYGGEEFIVLFPATEKEHAFQIAERIREKTQNHLFTDQVHITISAGIQEYHNQTITDFIAAADEKLYQAKHLGRNQVIS
jgi:diguanylate cyclase